MGTRSSVLELIAHDPVLGPLLSNGRNGRSPHGHSPTGIPADLFIGLEWTAPQASSHTARTGLTVRAHLLRSRSTDSGVLEFLLQRARRVLTTGIIIMRSGRQLEIRYRGTSHVRHAGQSGTIHKESRFDIHDLGGRVASALQRRADDGGEADRGLVALPDAAERAVGHAAAGHAGGRGRRRHLLRCPVDQSPVGR